MYAHTCAHTHTHTHHAGKLRLLVSAYEASVGHMIECLCENNLYNFVVSFRATHKLTNTRTHMHKGLGTG